MREVDSSRRAVEELQELIDGHDAHGWESLDEEQHLVGELLHARRELSRLLEPDPPDPAIGPLEQRLAELNEEMDAEVRSGEEWVESAAIRVGRIGPNIKEEAERYFGTPQGYAGVLAFCRHHRTNYDELVAKAPEYPAHAVGMLRERVNAAIDAALSRVGLDEFGLDWIEES